jgi:hypothetical protein
MFLPLALPIACIYWLGLLAGWMLDVLHDIITDIIDWFVYKFKWNNEAQKQYKEKPEKFKYKNK